QGRRYDDRAGALVLPCLLAPVPQHPEVPEAETETREDRDEVAHDTAPVVDASVGRRVDGADVHELHADGLTARAADEVDRVADAERDDEDDPRYLADSCLHHCIDDAEKDAVDDPPREADAEPRVLHRRAPATGARRLRLPPPGGRRRRWGRRQLRHRGSVAPIQGRTRRAATTVERQLLNYSY